LKEHPEVMREIEVKVHEKFGIKTQLAAVPDAPAEEAAEEKRPRVKAVK
jgi:hypothetical protein